MLLVGGELEILLCCEAPWPAATTGDEKGQGQIAKLLILHGLSPVFFEGRAGRRPVFWAGSRRSYGLIGTGGIGSCP